MTQIQQRCDWCGKHLDYQHYHDHEWGRPVSDDQRLFEKVCLEGFQSGLSWLTILRKRDNFRQAFSGFDFDQVAGYGDVDVARLLENSGIVRHRKKIEAAINNARQAQHLRDEYGSLSQYFWRFVPPESERPRSINRKSIYALSQTPTSTAMAKDLKQRGWRFVGPTTAYAFMQAMGLVNDHFEDCGVREAVEQERQAFLHSLSINT